MERRVGAYDGNLAIITAQQEGPHWHQQEMPRCVLECAMNPACTAEVPCPTRLPIGMHVSRFHSVYTPIGRVYVKLWEESSKAAHPQSSDSGERACRQAWTVQKEGRHAG